MTSPLQSSRPSPGFFASPSSRLRTVESSSASCASVGSSRIIAASSPTAARKRGASAHGEHRRADHRRDLGGRDPLELVQLEHGSLLFRKPIQKPSNSGHSRAPRGVFVGEHAAVGLDVVAHLAREHGAAPRGASHHQHDVHADAVEPRRELRLAAKLDEAPVHLEEDLLHDVFGVGRRAEHAVDEARHVALVPAEQLRERRAIPAFGAALDDLFDLERPRSSATLSGRLLRRARRNEPGMDATKRWRRRRTRRDGSELRLHAHFFR